MSGRVPRRVGRTIRHIGALVYGSPDLPAGAVDKAAYAVCVLEQLHRALRRRDVYVRGADRWGDPRARLLDGHAWEVARPRTLEALGLTADPGEHLGELAGTLDAAYRQLADGLPANAVEIRDGRLRLERLRAASEPAALTVPEIAKQLRLTEWTWRRRGPRRRRPSAPVTGALLVEP